MSKTAAIPPQQIAFILLVVAMVNRQFSKPLKSFKVITELNSIAYMSIFRPLAFFFKLLVWVLQNKMGG